MNKTTLRIKAAERKMNAYAKKAGAFNKKAKQTPRADGTWVDFDHVVNR